MSEVDHAAVTESFVQKITMYAHTGLTVVMSAIYNIIIAQIIVSWHTGDIVPHNDWQYFSPFGT